MHNMKGTKKPASADHMAGAEYPQHFKQKTEEKE
jgi:hypothetical protein